MSRTELAKRSGIARTSISTILGRGKCTAATLGKIARGLDVRAEEISGHDPNGNKEK